MGIQIYIDAPEEEVEVYRHGEQACIDACFRTARVKKPKARDFLYRLHVNIRPEFREYLAEMAWRNRTSIAEYINRLLEADMIAHPEWHSGIIEDKKPD